MSAHGGWTVATDPGLVVQRTCEHLDQAGEFPLPAVRECEDCRAAGTGWVHLRQCLVCGHVACCDSSPKRHAYAHAQAHGGHDLARSIERGEEWAWCYADDLFLRPAR
ncbi:UBP-type zinc finger domain-containing protein [Kitasatospora camelliae]|uniref:UBP-type zinc finger domain-containing protein n=1 Tax=Kitasatospora camelliae TaxID=3156397 RepID=A0AAU8K6K5_9ACTN